MSESVYNGWTNRATWTVALWIYNDQGLADLVIEAAENTDVEKAARLVKAAVEELVLQESEGLASDLLTVALAQVDWAEVVEKISS